jgi:hypothetical protein
MITFVNTVPISATRSVNRFCLIRNFAAWEGFDEWARRAMFKILSEDKVGGWSPQVVHVLHMGVCLCS